MILNLENLRVAAYKAIDRKAEESVILSLTFESEGKMFQLMNDNNVLVLERHEELVLTVSFIVHYFFRLSRIHILML